MAKKKEMIDKWDRHWEWLHQSEWAGERHLRRRRGLGLGRLRTPGRLREEGRSKCLHREGGAGGSLFWCWGPGVQAGNLRRGGGHLHSGPSADSRSGDGSSQHWLRQFAEPRPCWLGKGRGGGAIGNLRRQAGAGLGWQAAQSEQ